MQTEPRGEDWGEVNSWLEREKGTERLSWGWGPPSPTCLSPAQNFTSRSVGEVVWGYRDRLEPLYLERYQMPSALSMDGITQARRVL